MAFVHLNVKHVIRCNGEGTKVLFDLQNDSRIKSFCGEVSVWAAHQHATGDVNAPNWVLRGLLRKSTRAYRSIFTMPFLQSNSFIVVALSSPSPVNTAHYSRMNPQLMLSSHIPHLQILARKWHHSLPLWSSTQAFSRWLTISSLRFGQFGFTEIDRFWDNKFSLRNKHGPLLFKFILQQLTHMLLTLYRLCHGNLLSGVGSFGLLFVLGTVWFAVCRSFGASSTPFTCVYSRYFLPSLISLKKERERN